MRANPKPVNVISFAQPQRAIANAYTDRVDWLSSTHLLKLETWVVRIQTPEGIRAFSLLPSFSWKRIKLLTELW